MYVELQCASETEALSELDLIGAGLVACGASEEDTWVARNDIDRECQRFFRHAVPESVNMLIDERRRTDARITKLGSDMSVPNDHLREVMELYRTTLAEAGLEYATWGHIGNNHLHVNVLPRSMDDYAAGKALFARWAEEVTRMGGAVSAEHGVGKMKAGFLEVMYGREHIREMARVKAQLDPQGVLGRGNLFGAEVLAEALAEVRGARRGSGETAGASAGCEAQAAGHGAAASACECDGAPNAAGEKACESAAKEGAR